MSSLKLKHSGGNSVIIAGPSSNPAADRTINLNDNYAGDGSFVTANSSGYVGIGTANPSSFNADGRNLVVGTGSGGQGLSIYSANDNYGNVYFADGTSDGSYNAGGILYNHSSNFMRFDTAAVERMRIDSSGRLGLGRVPGSWHSNNTAVVQMKDGGSILTRSGGTFLGLYQNIEYNSSDVSKYTASAAASAYIQSNGVHKFYTTPSGSAGGDATFNERMRITNDGKVGIGTNSPSYLFNVVSSSNDMCRFQQTTNDGGSSYSMIFMKHAAATSGSNGIDITFQNSSGTTVGQIDHGQSTTQYRTSSDYRLKENATAISDGITRLKTLKPYRFNWISEPDQPKVDGFFAHEVTPAVPEAISGTKDEVDSDKKPVYQGIDQSKLVPLLTAALQEAIAKIEVLETKVAALEAG